MSCQRLEASPLRRKLTRTHHIANPGKSIRSVCAGKNKPQSFKRLWEIEIQGKCINFKVTSSPNVAHIFQDHGRAHEGWHIEGRRWTQAGKLAQACSFQASSGLWSYLQLMDSWLFRCSSLLEHASPEHLGFMDCLSSVLDVPYWLYSFLHGNFPHYWKYITHLSAPFLWHVWK